MRPIIEYHGPLFQLLRDGVMRLGHDHAVLAWRLAVPGWLGLLTVLALTNRYKMAFTGLVLMGVLLLRLPGLGLGEQNVDESQWIASAATLVGDPRFWVSVDGTTSGPFNVWPPTLIYYVGSSLDYASLRAWGLLTAVGPTVWLLLATFRLQFGERLARLAILPVVVCLALTTDPDGVAFNSEQLPMCLLALTGYCLSRVFTRPPATSPGGLGALTVAGLALGSLPYTKLQTVPIGLVVALWVITGLLARWQSERRATRSRLLWFIGSGLLPTGLVGLYCAWVGVFDYAVRSYIVVNLAYAQEGSWSAGAVNWADRLLVRLPQIYGAMPTTRWFWWVVGVSGVAGLFLVDNAVRGRQFWFAGSVFLVAVYATLQPGNPFAHYQWLAFVPGSWLIATGLAASDEKSRDYWASGLRAVWLGAVVGFPGSLAVLQTQPAIWQLSGGGWPSAQRLVSAAIRRYALPNERLVVWGWQNNLHVETGLLMGSRFIPLYFPVVNGPEQAYFLEVYTQDLHVNKPAVFVDAVRLHPGGGYDQYPVRRYPAVQTLLNTQYRLVETVQGAKIYRRMP